MAGFCIPTILERDTETGCALVSCNDNATAQYEACRQSFYLKQQNEILKQSSQQQQAATSANNDQKVKALESQNTDFQKITDQQNQQITQFIQSSEQAAHKIENLNLINTILIVVLVVIACAFSVVKFMKRRVASK